MVILFPDTKTWALQERVCHVVNSSAEDYVVRGINAKFSRYFAPVIRTLFISKLKEGIEFFDNDQKMLLGRFLSY